MQISPELAGIILARLGMRGDILLQKLQDIKENAFNHRKNLIAQYQNWDEDKDARLISIQKLINVIDRTQFQIHIIGKLLNEEWYRNNLEHETQQSQEYKKMLIVEIEIMTKYKFGMAFFTIIETYFRIFLRSIDPIACNGATSAFAKIAENLLGVNQLNVASDIKQDAIELLIFIRYIRNLIHNGGVYFGDDGLDKTINYKGVPYIFSHGKQVDFVYWDLLINLATDILQLLKNIISQPRLIQLPNVIDPSKI